MTVVPRWSSLLSFLCFLTANVFLCVAIKIAVFIWWRVNDRRNSNKVTWSDSIFFRFLATWECFIGKIYHANILPTDISSNRSKNLLISDGIIIKSKITNAWVIFSSTNCSLLTKVIFKWILTKTFLSTHIWHDVAEETSQLLWSNELLFLDPQLFAKR